MIPEWFGGLIVLHTILGIIIGFAFTEGVITDGDIFSCEAGFSLASWTDVFHTIYRLIRWLLFWFIILLFKVLKEIYKLPYKRSV